jgi:hypothetical protein
MLDWIIPQGLNSPRQRGVDRCCSVWRSQFVRIFDVAVDFIYERSLKVPKYKHPKLGTQQLNPHLTYSLGHTLPSRDLGAMLQIETQWSW